MSPADMSKVESGIRLVVSYREAFNRHDVATMAGLLGEDCVFETDGPGPDGASLSGRETIKAYLGDLIAGRADARIEVEEVFGFGARCIMRCRYEWKDAEGRQAHRRALEIFDTKNGLICRVMAYVKG